MRMHGKMMTAYDMYPLSDIRFSYEKRSVGAHAASSSLTRRELPFRHADGAGIYTEVHEIFLTFHSFHMVFLKKTPFPSEKVVFCGKPDVENCLHNEFSTYGEDVGMWIK